LDCRGRWEAGLDKVELEIKMKPKFFVKRSSECCSSRQEAPNPADAIFPISSSNKGYQLKKASSDDKEEPSNQRNKSPQIPFPNLPIHSSRSLPPAPPFHPTTLSPAIIPL
jgi:hypothetical protein